MTHVPETGAINDKSTPFSGAGFRGAGFLYHNAPGGCSRSRATRFRAAQHRAECFSQCSSKRVQQFKERKKSRIFGF